MEEITFEIKKHLGVLKKSPSGWARELNIISWCDRPAKYDIREWTPDHKKFSRGIALSDEEALMLAELIIRENSRKDRI